MGSGGTLPIGPGIWGFIAFFVLAVALWLLVRNMNARLRRMAYRDRERAEADALTTPGADQPGGGEPGGEQAGGEQAGGDQAGTVRPDAAQGDRAVGGDHQERDGADGEAPSDGRARP